LISTEGDLNTILVNILMIIGAIFTIVYRFRLLNSLRAVGATFRVSTLFEDLGRLIALRVVLVLSLVGGVLFSQRGVDVSLVPQPNLVITLQRSVCLFTVVWLRDLFVLAPPASYYWARFGGLGVLRTHYVGARIKIAENIFECWECGWVETLGPRIVQQISQNILQTSYLLSGLVFKTLLAQIFVSGFVFWLLV
jgi:hypothetical protein